MTLVRACAESDFDAATATCTHEVWLSQPAFLPPLPAAEGLQVSGAIITVVAGAWALKYVRRFIWPKA